MLYKTLNVLKQKFEQSAVFHHITSTDNLTFKLFFWLIKGGSSKEETFSAKKVTKVFKETKSSSQIYVFLLRYLTYRWYDLTPRG